MAIITDDAGFSAAGFPGKYRLFPDVIEQAQEGNLFVARLKPDGSKEWERPVSWVRVNAGEPDHSHS